MNKYMINILFFFYDILFLLGMCLCMPVYFWRKKITWLVLREKLGAVCDLTGQSSIWIHAVSVGEVNLIGKLIEELAQKVKHRIVISVTTLTGYKVAVDKYGYCARIIYLPYDLTFAVNRFIAKINPLVFISVETEIWPNLYYRLYRRKIPICIINGRISDKALRRYKILRRVFCKVLNMCSFIAVQNEIYKKKFMQLGYLEEKIIVAENMKFTAVNPDPKKLTQICARVEPRIKNRGSLLIMAASTHAAEEDAVLKIYIELLKQNSNLNLLIAPRHINRVSIIEKLITANGFMPVLLSKSSNQSITSNSVVVLDEIGQLLYFYALADICFVGGSLIPHGGQNILEPIYFSKPTLFGQYMNNFSDIEETVLTIGAGIKVKDARDLQEKIAELIAKPHLRAQLAKNCRLVFTQKQAQADKNIETVLNLIAKTNG